MADPTARPSSISLTSTSSAFTQPSVNGLVTVNVGSSLWMKTGQKVFVEGGGLYFVDSKPTGTSVSLRNPGYSGNTGSGVSISSGSAIYSMGSAYNTGVADPDGALSPSITGLSSTPATGLPRSGMLINSSSGTSGTVTGLFYGIQPLEDCVVNSLTLAPGYEGADLVAGMTLTAGQVYNIGFTSIKLNSGTATIWRGA